MTSDTAGDGIHSQAHSEPSSSSSSSNPNPDPKPNPDPNPDPAPYNPGPIPDVKISYADGSEIPYDLAGNPAL
jgi:hypothetical protein